MAVVNLQQASGPSLKHHRQEISSAAMAEVDPMDPTSMQSHPTNSEDWIAELAGVLAMGHRRDPPDRQFAPELSYGRHRGPIGSQAKAAAVVMLLYPRQGQWHLPLILRPASMRAHARQICLPGGGAESGETPQGCALRELHEELGVSSNHVSVLAQLPAVVVFASNFHVTPLVATCATPPDFRPNPAEVEQLFEVPLSHILNKDHTGYCLVERGHLRFLAPSIPFGEHHIWGATAIILGSLIERLGKHGIDTAGQAVAG